MPQSNLTQFEGLFEEEYQAGPTWAGLGLCLVKSEAEPLELGLIRISVTSSSTTPAVKSSLATTTSGHLAGTVAGYTSTSNGKLVSPCN